MTMIEAINMTRNVLVLGRAALTRQDPSGLIQDAISADREVLLLTLGLPVLPEQGSFVAEMTELAVAARVHLTAQVVDGSLGLRSLVSPNDVVTISGDKREKRRIAEALGLLPD
jgi:hypothetical protein